MLSPEERREQIAVIASFPLRLKDRVDGMSDAQLDTPYAPGKWTVRQVVHHLADAHMHAFLRMKNVMTQETPTLTVYDQVRYAEMPDTTHASVAMSLDLLRGLHKRWVVFLENLQDHDWQKSAVHFRRGEMSLDDMLTLYAWHGENHLNQINDLCAAHGWGSRADSRLT